MTLRGAIEASAQAIEALAVALIVSVIAMATAQYLVSYLGAGVPQAYDEYRHRVARALLLTLEILVAADIVRTVALDASLRSIGGLGLLVVIRTFLSWPLTVETEGCWPWQQRHDAGVARHGATDRRPSDDRPAERAA